MNRYRALRLLLGVLFALPGPAAADWSDQALRRGIEHFKRGEFRKAWVELSVVVRTPRGAAGDDPAATLYLGYTAYKLKRYARATALIRRALAKDPSLDGPLPRFYLGLALYRRRLYFKARGHFERVVAVAGGGKLGARARRFLSMSNTALATANDRTPLAYHQMGVFRIERGRAAAAVDFFREALRWTRIRLRSNRATDQYRESTLYLIAALCLSNRCKSALRLISRARGLKQSYRLRLARAIALTGVGKFKRAGGELKRLKGGSPRIRRAVRTLTRAVEGRR